MLPSCHYEGCLGSLDHWSFPSEPSAWPSPRASLSPPCRPARPVQGPRQGEGLPPPWLQGCGGGDAAAAWWEAQGSGGSSWLWGPSEGVLALLWRKVQLSLPPSPIPLLLSFTLFFFPSSLPASHSCCLGDPDLVREERGSGVRAAASAGWRGAAVG